VVEITIEKGKKEVGWQKTGVGAGFFQTLALDFFPLNSWNSPLFIEGGRGIFFLY
jgi:hypothetical protein